MNYRALNDIQRKRMLQISKNDFSMEWENPDFFDILIGKLPTIHHYQTGIYIIISLTFPIL